MLTTTFSSSGFGSISDQQRILLAQNVLDSADPSGAVSQATVNIFRSIASAADQDAVATKATTDAAFQFQSGKISSIQLSLQAARAKSPSTSPPPRSGGAPSASIPASSQPLPGGAPGAPGAKKDNTMLFLILGGAAAVAAVGGVSYMYYRRRR